MTNIYFLLHILRRGGGRRGCAFTKPFLEQIEEANETLPQLSDRIDCPESLIGWWLECISYIDLLISWLNLTVDFPLTFCHIEVRAFPLVN